MYSFFVFIILYVKVEAIPKDDYESGSDDLGTGLVTSLRNDANLDLSVDEEYEDLRAELLAYHSALSSLASSRRSLGSTPCWSLGGICINHNLCPRYRHLTEVPGCKNKLNVCCFVWNQYEVRDMKDKGINNIAFPWSPKHDYGGEGIVIVNKKKGIKKRRSKPTAKPSAVVIKLKTYQMNFGPKTDSVLTKYKDVFIPGLNGKPQLGSGLATCWARGGVCVHIRDCPSMNFDAGVFGCSKGYNVCCRVIRPLSPTVGAQRTYDVPSDLEKEDDVIENRKMNNKLFLVLIP